MAAGAGSCLVVRNLCSQALVYPNHAVLVPGLVPSSLGVQGSVVVTALSRKALKPLLSPRFLFRSLFLAVSWELWRLPWQ